MRRFLARLTALGMLMAMAAGCDGGSSHSAVLTGTESCSPGDFKSDPGTSTSAVPSNPGLGIMSARLTVSPGGMAVATFRTASQTPVPAGLAPDTQITYSVALNSNSTEHVPLAGTVPTVEWMITYMLTPSGAHARGLNVGGLPKNGNLATPMVTIGNDLLTISEDLHQSPALLKGFRWHLDVHDAAGFNQFDMDCPAGGLEAFRPGASPSQAASATTVTAGSPTPTARSVPTPTTGRGSSSPFGLLVAKIQSEIRAGTFPGSSALPDATVTCPNPVALTVGNAFGCNVESQTAGSALAIITVTGSGGSTFSGIIGTDLACSTLTPAQAAALDRLRANSTCATTTTTTTSLATPLTAPANPSAAYDNARSEWEAGANDSSANQSGDWRQTATDLRAGQTDAVLQQEGVLPAVQDLDQLATLPDAMLTPSQQQEQRADISALDSFFHTAGLYD